jgi:hypothetical protein
MTTIELATDYADYTDFNPRNPCNPWLIQTYLTRPVVNWNHAC